MTNINDLQERISSAEAVLEALKADLEALKEQEQQEPESLFGHWATHPEHGRGIIASSRTDDGNRALFGNIGDPSALVAQWRYVPIGELTLDPVTLTTAQEFENAPIGTIIEIRETAVARKISKQWWDRSGIQEPWSNVELSDEIGTCRVIRWGNGQ